MRKELDEHIESLIGKTDVGIEWFSAIFPNQVNPYAELRNSILLVEQIIDHTYQVLENPERQAQTYSRIITITRWAYVAIFSVMEHSLKEIIKEYLTIDCEDFIDKWNNGGYTSFYSITNRLKCKEYLDEKIFDQLDYHREIRNCVINNNAVSSKTKTYPIEGITVEAIQGVSLSGPIHGFLVLSESLMKYYMLLLAEIKNKHRIQKKERSKD